MPHPVVFLAGMNGFCFSRVTCFSPGEVLGSFGTHSTLERGWNHGKLMYGKMGEEELGGQNLGLTLKQNKQANRKHYIAETRGIHSNWEEGGNLLLPLKVAGALTSSSYKVF